MKDKATCEVIEVPTTAVLTGFRHEATGTALVLCVADKHAVRTVLVPEAAIRDGRLKGCRQCEGTHNLVRPIEAFEIGALRLDEDTKDVNELGVRELVVLDLKSLQRQIPTRASA